MLSEKQQHCTLYSVVKGNQSKLNLNSFLN